MSRETGIEWTGSTFNCWMGCTNISPGCERCYAEAWSKRVGLVQWGNHPRRRTSAANWKQAVQWNADAARFQAEQGRRQRVFCASLADWFGRPNVWLGTTVEREDFTRRIDTLRAVPAAIASATRTSMQIPRGPRHH